MDGVFFVTEETDVMFQEENLRICVVADSDGFLICFEVNGFS